MLPVGLLLWFIWNAAVLSSVQLTVRLIHAFSLVDTLRGAAAMTLGSVPIALIYLLALHGSLVWFPLPIALTGLLAFVVLHRVLRIRRLRSRLLAAVGVAVLSAPWPALAPI